MGRPLLSWTVGLCCASLALACNSTDAEPEDETTRVLGDGIHGPQRVPAGGSLEGQHDGQATVESGDTGAAVVVDTARGQTTVVRGVNIRSRGGVGLLVRGDGVFVGEGLVIDCEAGFGVAAEGLERFELSNSIVRGNITLEEVPGLGFPLDGSLAPIVGMALSRVEEADIDQVTVSGFGGFGTILVDSSVGWSGGAIKGNVGIGLFAEGGKNRLEGLEISDTWAPQLGLAFPAYGAVVKGGASVDAVDLRVAANEGVGILQHEASGRFERLVAQDNDDVGLWVQHVEGTAQQPGAAVLGEGTDLSRNRGGGMFVLDAAGVDLRDVTVTATGERSVVSTESVLATMADGIQIAGLRGDLTIRNTSLNDNVRVGLLLSGAPPAGATVDIDGVDIAGDGAYGMIVQDAFPVPPAGAVTRTNALAEADQALSSILALAEPRMDLAQLGAVREGRLIGEGGMLDAEGVLGHEGVVSRGGLGSSADAGP